jgi:hypothetical protein
MCSGEGMTCPLSKISAADWIAKSNACAIWRKKKITPAARLKTAQSLRKMSEKLAQMAADIEAKVEPKADSR